MTTTNNFFLAKLIFLKKNSIYHQFTMKMFTFKIQSAEDFAESINKLTDDENHKISKEMIKKLFSIEIESDISHSLFVKKVQMPFVSERIADIFQCPDVIITLLLILTTTQNI